MAQVPKEENTLIQEAPQDKDLKLFIDAALGEECEWLR